MKYPALVLFAALPVRLADAADASAYKLESQEVSEVFTTKIVKVYSVREGSHSFVAYVVTWKEHEVVIVPPPYFGFANNLRVDETVRCQMRQSRIGPAGSDLKTMTFTLLPPGPTAEEESARLERVSAEVVRRRMVREEEARMPNQQSKLPNKAPEPTPGPVTPRAPSGDSK